MELKSNIVIGFLYTENVELTEEDICINNYKENKKHEKEILKKILSAYSVSSVYSVSNSLFLLYMELKSNLVILLLLLLQRVALKFLEYLRV